MTLQVIIDKGDLVARGQTYGFVHTLTKGDATWPLDAATVTATIRAEDDPDTVLDASLEGIAVSGDASGVVTWTLSKTLSSALSAPSADASAFVKHVLTYKVVEADATEYFAAPFRLRVWQPAVA